MLLHCRSTTKEKKKSPEVRWWPASDIATLNDFVTRSTLYKKPLGKRMIEAAAVL